MTRQINVDLDPIMALLEGRAAAPTYVAATETTIESNKMNNFARSDRFRRYRHDPEFFVMYDGRSRVETIHSGAVVIIDTSDPRFWRINRSKTSTPNSTPLRIKQNPGLNGFPIVAKRIVEARGFAIYKTPGSLLEAAKYQHSHGRRDLALEFLDEAIWIRARFDKGWVTPEIDKAYKTFKDLLTRALHEGHDEALVAGSEGERVTCTNVAMKRGERLLLGGTV